MDSQQQTNGAITQQNAGNSQAISESGAPSTLAFKATIELKQQSLTINETPLPLAAGMRLSAEIVEG